MTDKDKLIAELKAENEWLKEEFEIESLTDNTTGETFYRSNKVNKLKEELATYGATGVCEVCSDKANKLADKYLRCLQEIKAISEEFIKNVSEDCINITPMFLVHKEIIQKITKAEEE